MSDPLGLFRIVAPETVVPSGLHMLAGLTGFTDAGGSISQMADNIFANYDYELLVEFENDEFLDYRARRPVMYFEKDHISDYEPAVLGIYLVYDEANSPFLLLHGYEPDFKWEAFTEAVLQLVEFFEVADFTWLHSIPFPIPHTRALGVTVSGNRQDVIDAQSEWKPETQVPGNVLHLLEYKLSETGLPLIGFVLLVPHYLSDSEYPQAALTGFERISALTGLVFKTDPLRDEAARFTKQLNEQLEQNTELAALVQSLEQGYMSDKSGPGRTPIRKPSSQIPSAEEIAAELEDYLSTRRRNQDTAED